VLADPANVIGVWKAGALVKDNLRFSSVEM